MVPQSSSSKSGSFSNDYLLAKEYRKCVTGFIEDVWNSHRLELLSAYLHPEFQDFSLPNGLQNAVSLSAYLQELRKNITHHTTIEKLITEKDFIVIKVKMTLSSIENPYNKFYQHRQEEMLFGYRILAMCDQRIIGHWEFLDRI